MKTPSALTDYATDAEIAAANAELEARVAMLSVDLRKARAAARAVHVLFDFNPRSRSGKSAARALKKALPPESKGLVDHAERVAEHRAAATRAIEYLSQPGADLARAMVIAATADEVTGNACPVFTAVVDRWKAAVAANGEHLMTVDQACQLGEREAMIEKLERRFKQLRAQR